MSFSRLIECGTRLALPLIIGLATVGSLPAPAQAQSPMVNLELGGEEATSWNMSDIEPGDSGTKTVRLHNAGSRKGSVAIWISDIVSSEGKNPESETGDTTEPGELVDYSVFNLSCNRLYTNIALPAAPHGFPQSASDSNYIKIEHLYAGETLTLIWQWEFLETGEPQNDTQGDSLSFTINYLLEELPPDDGGGGDSEPSYRILNVDILGKVTKCKVNSSGKLLYSYVATDPDNKRKLELPKGTGLTCANGEILRRIEMKVYEEALSIPTGMEIVGPAFELAGYTKDSVPCSVTFYQPARLTLSYDPSWLPQDTSPVYIASCDVGQDWKELELAPDSAAELGGITALISHTSTFAILAKLEPSPPHTRTHPPPPPSPLSAHFVASDLNIIVTEEKTWAPITFVTKTGESVGITANIANDGGQEGTYIADLEIDGEIADTEELILAAGQSQQVSFALSGLDYGQHQVELAELRGHFTVCRTINWWLIMGMIAALGSTIWAMTWGMRRDKTVHSEQQSP